MLTGGRIAAAIEILTDIDARHRPAADALRDWGASHRFAGSGDRAAIGNLVFDALRRRRSLAWRMGADTPRALVLGVVAFAWGLSPERLETVFAGDRHAPEALRDSERTALRGGSLEGAPDAVRADVPDWLWPAFAAACGEAAVAEGEALARRAPLDLRVNRLKADRARVLRALRRLSPTPTPLSPDGVRIAVPEGEGRAPNVQSDAGFRKGWFEVQDEGSQVAALLSGARAGDQVADICAGAGGKTLALAAMMGNKGQIHAWDADRHRLANIFDRLRRAGTRNVQVLEAGDAHALAALRGRMDIVLVDAPCTGTGVWRRRPDAKWRLSPEALARRTVEQDAALETAAGLVRPGGRIVYVTCSLIGEENGARVSAFLDRHPDFVPAPFGAAIDDTKKDEGQELVNHVSSRDVSTRLTPLRHGTDGFFIANLARRA